MSSGHIKEGIWENGKRLDDMSSKVNDHNNNYSD